jgi:hypothetical protein
MKKQKKHKPNWVQDKYGMLYDANAPLSENDKNILKLLAESLAKKKEQ